MLNKLNKKFRAHSQDLEQNKNEQKEINEFYEQTKLIIEIFCQYRDRLMDILFILILGTFLSIILLENTDYFTGFPAIVSWLTFIIVGKMIGKFTYEERLLTDAELIFER